MEAPLRRPGRCSCKFEVDAGKRFYTAPGPMVVCASGSLEMRRIFVVEGHRGLFDDEDLVFRLVIRLIVED